MKLQSINMLFYIKKQLAKRNGGGMIAAIKKSN